MVDKVKLFLRLTNPAFGRRLFHAVTFSPECIATKAIPDSTLEQILLLVVEIHFGIAMQRTLSVDDGDLHIEESLFDAERDFR